MSSSIAIIGDRDTVIGFRMAGVRESTVPETPEETKNALLSYFRNPNIGLILITEPLAKSVGKTIIELSESPIPVIMLIPDRDGSTGAYEKVLKELIRRAVGIDIKV